MAVIASRNAPDAAFCVATVVTGVGDGAIDRLECRVAEPGRDFRAAAQAVSATACASVCALPFATAAFEEVLAVEMLERLAKALRPAAIHELARVAAKRLIIRVPAGVFATTADNACAAYLQNDGCRGSCQGRRTDGSRATRARRGARSAAGRRLPFYGPRR